MEIKLISPSGNIIKLPYYEILNYASLLCEKFISLNENNKKLFDEFKKNYNFFLPYFDFMILKLNYKMEDPFFRNGILLSKNDEIFFKDKLTHKEFLYPKSDDISIGLNNDYDNLDTCLIDYDGNIFNINKTKKFHHEEYEEKILNEFMINNKEICEDYCNYINSKNVKTVGFYMREHLGFAKIAIDDNVKIAVYAANLVNEDITSKIKLIPNIMIDSNSISEEQLETALNLINKVGKVK